MGVVESIGVAASGRVLSLLLAKPLNKYLDSLGINDEKMLQELSTIILPKLELVIEKVEGSEHRSKLEELLQMLKDAYVDKKDMLDHHKYKQLKRQVAAANRSRMGLIIIWVHTLSRSLHCRDRLPQRKIKLRQGLNKLEEIIDKAEKLCAPVQTEKRVAVPDSINNISLPPHKVFGRDKDCETIIQHLKTEPAATSRNSGSTDIPVIAIVGRSGFGKTTLAQYICKQLSCEQLRNELGDRRFVFLWVNASCSFRTIRNYEKHYTSSS